MLERQAESEDDVTRVGLWNKIAALYQNRLSKADKAQKAFEKALSLDSGNLIAAEALIPIYEKMKEATKLAGVLQVQLLHTTEPTLRQERMQRITQILDAEAGQKSSALAVALQATTENPVEVWALEAGQRLAAETGEWAALVQVYESVLPSLKGNELLPLLSTLAGAYEKELANYELGIQRNKQILALAPSDEQAVLALERLAPRFRDQAHQVVPPQTLRSRRAGIVVNLFLDDCAVEIVGSTPCAWLVLSSTPS